MRYFQAKVAENRVLGGGYFVLRLAGCASLSAAKPGQFVMIRGAWGRDPLLPRAFSLLSVAPAAGTADVLAKDGRAGHGAARAVPARGRGRCARSAGYQLPDAGSRMRRSAGRRRGGAPPLYMQGELAAAQKLAARSELLYGGRGAPDLVLLREMESDGPRPAPDDRGRLASGRRGWSRARSRRAWTPTAGKRVRVMGCGPNAMLWAVARLARERESPCFISLEEQMACGIGVCLGCAIPARSRPYRYVCSNGPVFDAADVLDVNPHRRVATPPPPSECPA